MPPRFWWRRWTRSAPGIALMPDSSITLFVAPESNSASGSQASPEPCPLPAQVGSRPFETQNIAKNFCADMLRYIERRNEGLGSSAKGARRNGQEIGLPKAQPTDAGRFTRSFSGHPGTARAGDSGSAGMALLRRRSGRDAIFAPDPDQSRKRSPTKANLDLPHW